MKSREPTHNQQTRSVCNALAYARDCMAFSRKAQALPRRSLGSAPLPCRALALGVGAVPDLAVSLSGDGQAPFDKLRDHGDLPLMTDALVEG